MRLAILMTTVRCSRRWRRWDAVRRHLASCTEWPELTRDQSRGRHTARSADEEHAGSFTARASRNPDRRRPPSPPPAIRRRPVAVCRAGTTGFAGAGTGPDGNCLDAPTCAPRGRAATSTPNLRGSSSPSCGELVAGAVAPPRRGWATHAQSMDQLTHARFPVVVLQAIRFRTVVVRYR